MTRSILISVLALALLTACGAIAEPTVTPTPSITPTPSDTPTPSSTATNTPDIPATETRVAERTAEFIATYEPFLNLVGYQITQGEFGTSLNRSVVARITSAYSVRTWENMPSGSFGNMIFHANITWDTSTGLAGCGIHLLGDGDFSDGRFLDLRFYRLSGFPAWESAIIEFNQVQGYTSGRRNSSNLINVDNGATNELLIIVDHPNIIYYMNGERLGAGTLPLGMTEGRIAFSVFQESGTTTCTYTDVWVWELP